MPQKKNGTPILTYPEFVGVLTRRYDTIAVAGAHGKSTTTSLIAIVAEAAKLDPTVIVGTKLKEFKGSNFKKGKSNWLILEADEFGRAFLNYSPRLVIVTNIDREHLDIYKNIADIKSTFMTLFDRVAPKGVLVLNADNANLLSLKPRIEKLAEAKDLKVYWYSSKDRIAKTIREALKVPGAHNVSNALGVYTLARKVLGVPEEKIVKALSGFKGSWRRYEYKGAYKFAKTNYEVYDDYAHHPTEIQATLGAFKEKFQDHTLVCVFQPHQAERLKRLFPEFKKSFDAADVLVLFPEYKVAGRDDSPTPFTSRALALAIQKRNPKAAVSYVEDAKTFSKETIEEALLRTDFAKKKVVVVMMGAGSIVQYTKNLLSI
jgi:UDP-N-acetylmuramate--alanine ligase